MARGRRQGGFMLIAAIVLIVVAAALAVTIALIAGTSAGSASDNLQSGQALYAAESGLEVEQRCLAENVDWYRSTTDPVTTAMCPTTPLTQSIGQGSVTFAVFANLPATKLRTRMTATSPPVGNDWIQVFSVDRFPASGDLLIDEDLGLGGGGELVHYTGLDVANRRFTGITRARTIGTVTGLDGAVPHDRGSGAYPVTTLVTAMASATCSVVPNPFQIVAHSKFLSAGTIDIEGEEISYSGSTIAGGNMTLSGVQRCLNISGGAAHPAGRPVTPVLFGDDSANYQAEMVSSGAADSTLRAMRKTVQR